MQLEEYSTQFGKSAQLNFEEGGVQKTHIFTKYALEIDYRGGGNLWYSL